MLLPPPESKEEREKRFVKIANKENVTPVGSNLANTRLKISRPVSKQGAAGGGKKSRSCS